MDLKTSLSAKLSETELNLLPRALEVVGDIAILELPDELISKKKAIANAVFDVQKNVKVVLNKVGEVEGIFRIPKMEIVAKRAREFEGIPKKFMPKAFTETVHRESGCRYKVDVSKAYFSARLSGERERIASQVKSRERILCLFAGVGPFAILPAKRKNVKIVAIEINPDAVEYIRENIEMNKIAEKIEVLLGDVAEVLPKIKGKFNRIIMPAPKNAADFLELALTKAKKGAIIHLYTFAPVEVIGALGEKIKARCITAGTNVDILQVRKAGEIGAYNFRVAVEIKVLN
ncbi:MAG: class I SAM-dependent methyltransferase family protein [Nanoarchaeota archaeon]|nr:class I SAM-dependent methyltransferase family protein [Nanoarchaeota archaeon]